MSRWAYTLEQRKYKCSRCLCLMGLYTLCLNDKCPAYGGKLKEKKS